MKKLLAYAALFAVVALTSCKYDDDDLGTAFTDWKTVSQNWRNSASR